MSDVSELMKRCQRGVGGRNALDEAHDIMAECYGTLGRLESERDALRQQLAERDAQIERLQMQLAACGELSYKAAKQKAWGKRDLTQCKCDHNEYCEHCWPDDFREGGKWHGGFETKQSAPERVSVPVELLERVCWPVASGSDRHTHSEAVAELRALLASHAEGGKV